MASSVMFYNCLSILGDTEVAELSQVVGAHLNRDMATYFAAPHRDESVAYVNSSFALGYIGEMAQQFDALAKMMALGLLPKGIVYFVGNDRSVANKYLLDLWQGTVKTVGPDEVGQIGVQVDRVLHIDSSFLLVDGRYYWKDVAYALVQKAWERQRRKPIVALRRESKRLGRLLEQAGWYDVGNIAVLHLRETKYYADRGLPDDQTFRNSDVRNLKGPLKFLVDRGVRVVRIGASGVAAAPAVAGVFDYANCDFKSEELEIELVAASSLYLGSHSGPMSVAASFGIPNCIFDDPQMFYPQAASTTVFVPKIFVRDGRALTFEESCSQPVRHIESDSQLREYGIAVTNNTEDEILGVVEEAFHRYIAKDYVEPAPVRELRAKLRRIQERRNIVSMGDVGGKFLCKYEYLLREPPR
jgi:putative glycosyltransferase (TIGR04372 family)